MSEEMMRETIERCQRCLTEATSALREIRDGAWERAATDNSSQLEQASRLAVACNELINSISDFEGVMAPMVEASPAGLATTVPTQPLGSFAGQPGHLLSEDFQGERPRGYILDGVVNANIKTWKKIYQGVCQFLATRFPEKYMALPDSEAMRTPRGRPLFSRSQAELNFPVEAGGIWGETAGTTEVLCSRMRQLICAFGLEEDILRVFLKGEERLMPRESTPIPRTASSVGQLWRPGEFKNPYRLDSDYWAIFDRIVSNPALTEDELLNWFMQARGKTAKQAKASVGVVISPVSQPNRLRGTSTNVCGNLSAQGHLYYVEEDADGKLHAFRRDPPLPPHRRR